MQVLFRGEMKKPYGMKDSEFYGVWLEEAKAAVAALKAGAIKGIWKVAGKNIVIGIIDVPDGESFNAMLMQLPVFAKGYSFLNNMDYDVLTSYEDWAGVMEKHLKTCT